MTRWTGPIVDCDVHQEVGDPNEVYDYLSPAWLEYVRGPSPHSDVPIFAAFPHVNPHGFDREDAIPPDGAPAASSLELIREQLLDSGGVRHAVLTSGAGMYVGAIANPYFAAEVARALNDHMVERWLGEEPRFKGSILLANQIPERAADEIHRLCDNPQVVQAMLCTNAIGHPFGHPVFDPIHRTCAESGIPLAIHAFGDGASHSAAPHMAGGIPSFYFEYHSGGWQGMATHLASFIAHGVFERYADLRLVLIEGGVGWLPSFISRLDANYRGLRREIPWVRRLPSETLRAHVTVTTQPLDLTGAGDPGWKALAHYGFDGMLLYASDYPHWDTDTPTQIAKVIPVGWEERVFWDNAAGLYGFEAYDPA